MPVESVTSREKARVSPATAKPPAVDATSPRDEPPPLPLPGPGLKSDMTTPTNDRSHHFALFGASPGIIAITASVAWMACSSGLIMLNNDLLSNGFPYPMALSGLGTGFSAIASYIACRVFRMVEGRRRVSWRFLATKIMPVGLFSALALATGNLVYLHLSVAFIQMLKSLMPIVTMVVLFLAGLETPTLRVILAVSVITAGTALASVGELNYSAIGVVIMLVSNVFEAMRVVATQVLLTGEKFHPIEGLMYLAPACTICLFLGSLVTEATEMAVGGAMAVIAARPIAFAAAAAMGFFVNLLTYIVIQSASSLTLKVLATMRNVLVVCLGVFFLHEAVTGLQAWGYGMSLAAFAWYQRLKMQQIGGDSYQKQHAERREDQMMQNSESSTAGSASSGVVYERLPMQESESKLPNKDRVIQFV